MSPHPLLSLLFLHVGTILVCRRPSLLGLSLAAVSYGAAFWFLRDSRRWRVSLGLIFFALLGLGLSWLRIEYHPSHPASQWNLRGPVDLLARVVRPPEVEPRQVRIDLRAIGVFDAGSYLPLNGGVHLSLYSPETRVRYGDTILVHQVKLHRPRPYQNPGAFDIAGYLEARNIQLSGGVSRDARITILERGGGPFLWREIYAQREQMISFIDAHPQGDDRSLFKAMVLGITGDLTPAVRDSFANAGTAHLLAISGLNAGFVAVLFYQLFRFLLRLLWFSPLGPLRLPARPSKVAALLTILPVLYYFAIADWSASIFRATIMVVFYLVYFSMARDRSLHEVLALAALVILFWQPASLFDIGFQLSFLSVLAIISSIPGARVPEEQEATQPPKWQERLLQKGCVWVKASLLTTFWATLGTTPLVLYYFNRLSLISLPANLVTVPLGSLIVPVGFVSLLLSLVSPSLAQPLFSLGLLISRLLMRATDFFAALPAASIRLPTPSGSAIVIFYMGLASWWLLRGKRWRVPASLVPVVASIIVFLWPTLFPERESLMTVSFIDVGQGESALLRFPDGRKFLIDGGGSFDGNFDFGERVVGPFLWRQQITRLDTVAVSHPQSDHAGGVPSILRNFRVENLWTGTGDARYEPLVLAGRGRTQWRVGRPGEVLLQGEDFGVRVLWPPAQGFSAEGRKRGAENNNSMVLKVHFRGVSFLFTGDLEDLGERELLRRYSPAELRSTVLKISHHGSKTGTLPEFLAAVQPEVGVISVGAFNPFGHPHPSVLDRLRAAGVRVYRTDHHPAITFETDGTRWRVSTFLPP